MIALALVLLVGGGTDGFRAPGSMTLGAFSAFYLLLAMLVMPLRMLGMGIGQAQRAIAAGERIFESSTSPRRSRHSTRKRRCFRRARARSCSRTSRSDTTPTASCWKTSTSGSQRGARWR